MQSDSRKQRLETIRKELYRVPAQGYRGWREAAKALDELVAEFAASAATNAVSGDGTPKVEHDCDYFNEVECPACNAGIPKPFGDGTEAPTLLRMLQEHHRNCVLGELGAASAESASTNEESGRGK